MICIQSQLAIYLFVSYIARATLKAGIMEAKQRHPERMQRDLNTSNTRRVGKRFRKSRSTKAGATLPDELNTFYARFDLLNKASAVKSALP